MWGLVRVLLALLLLAASTKALYPRAFEGITNENIGFDHYRLPMAVRPLTYRLQVQTFLDDPNNQYFEGEVQIRIEVLEETNNITLHALNLTINEARIALDMVDGNKKNSIVKTAINSRHDYYILYLLEPIYAGEQYILTIPFAAAFSDQLNGYYKSSYTDKKTGNTKWLAVTQFEPADARKAFPCFDEPEMKATFVVVLGHHERYQALSNMAVKEVRPIEGRENWIWTEFYESVPMSTYLVAYSVNDFQSVPSEIKLQHNVQFRTWARPDAIDQCAFAAEVGPKVLEYYENIFEIEFPLDKIDQIAIPDFSAGAMENWGLVTYRESALLYVPNVSSLAAKKRVAEIISHELAHQWFGNLVTMKWWTDLWLNEGFATYISSLGLENLFPEWKSYEEESLENTVDIFNVDALRSSHPISQPIHHTNEISQIFDSISYGKGSTVLRMMHLFLGDDAFHNGVRNYLRKHAYKNADQDDLWASLTESAHLAKSIPRNFEMKRIMDSWTLQTGYPIISVKRNYEEGSATVSQERYLIDSEVLRSEQMNCWWVPLSYTTQGKANFSETEAKQWLRCDANNSMIEETIPNLPGPDQWILFNIKLSGLYKVNYDSRNWNMLIKTLMSDNFETIHVVNRAQLIDDALSLAWSGDQDYEIALSLIEYLQREKEYIPWKTALDRLSDINRILKRTSEYEQFKKYMRHILTPIYIHVNGLNLTDSGACEADAYSVLHKVKISGWACRFDVHDCVPKAIGYYKEWRETKEPDVINPIPADLRAVVYCTALRHGSDEDWQFLWNRYEKSNVASEKRTILNALGCSRVQWVLARQLEWCFDETSGIRKQDASAAFVAVVHGDVGYHLAKEFFFRKFDVIYDYYKPDVEHVGRILEALSAQMSSTTDLETLKLFTKENYKLLSKLKQTVGRSLETVKLNVQWEQRFYTVIAQRLRSLRYAPNN